MRCVVFLILIAGVALVCATPAHGHANLERSDPPAGVVLAQSPPVLRLWFTEPLEGGFSEVHVLDERGRPVDRGDGRIAPGARTSMIVSLPALPRGAYSVAWRALSAVDGHVTRGVYSLLIGVSPTAEIAPPPQQIYATTSYEAAVRWMGYLATAALVGAACFFLFVLRPAGGAQPADMRTIVWAAWLLLVVAAAGSFAVQLTAVGGSGASLTSGPTATLLLRTRFGTVWVLRLAVILALGPVLLWLPRWVQGWWIAAALGCALLLTTALNSHAAAVQGWFPLISDWIHLIAGAAWVGGLFTFAVFLWRAGRAHSREDAELVAKVVPRFSTLAIASVALLTATGSYLTWVHVGGWRPLRDTLYGQSLSVKLVLVVPLVLLGAVNLFVIRPKLKTVLSREAVGVLANWLRRTVTVESALAVVVLLVAGIITSLPPAGQIYPMIAASTPFTVQTRAAGLRIALTASPGRAGPNVFLVQLREGGKSVPHADRVDIRFTFQDQSLGTAIERLRSQGDGRYAVRSAALGIAGLWQIEVLVRLPGRDDILTEFRVRVLASGFEIERAHAGWRRSRFLTRLGEFITGRRADVGTLQNPITPTPEALEIGSRIYQSHCAVCHGTDGTGHGPAAPRLNPRPADLRVHTAMGHSDGELFRGVSNGVSGTAMPAFRTTLTEEERWYVVTYLRNTFTPADK